MLNGLDDIGLTEEKSEAIAAFEVDEQGEILRDVQGLPRTPDFLLSSLGGLADTQSISVNRLPVARALWSKAVSEWPAVPAEEE